MNSNYSDPAYQAELEKEAMMKMIENLQNENKKLKETIQKQSQKENEQKEELALLKTKLVRREFTIATKIENIHRKVSVDNWHEGVVISVPLPYEGTHEYNIGRIHTFNWVYCQKLGLIRSINKKEVSMEFGRFYHFKCNDERNRKSYKKASVKRELTHMQAVRATQQDRRIHRHKTSIENGKLFIQVYFDIDACLLYDDKTIYFEDKYLNRVHLNGKMLGEVFNMAANPKIEGKLNIKTKVGLKEKFISKFKQDPNNPIFEVVDVQKITFDNGREVEAQRTEHGRVHYINLRR